MLAALAQAQNPLTVTTAIVSFKKIKSQQEDLNENEQELANNDVTNPHNKQAASEVTI